MGLAGNYEAALSDYARFDFAAGDCTRTVYVRGDGPAVIVIHEAPGRRYAFGKRPRSFTPPHPNPLPASVEREPAPDGQDRKRFSLATLQTGVDPSVLSRE